MNGETEGQTTQDKLAVFTQSLPPDTLAQINQIEDPMQRQAFIEKLYYDYAGQTEIAAENLGAANAMLESPKSEGIQAGRTYTANVGGAIGDLAKTVAGTVNRNKAMDRLDELSEKRTEATTELGKMLTQGATPPANAPAQMGAQRAVNQQAPDITPRVQQAPAPMLQPTGASNTEILARRLGARGRY